MVDTWSLYGEKQDARPVAKPARQFSHAMQI